MLAPDPFSTDLQQETPEQRSERMLGEIELSIVAYSDRVSTQPNAAEDKSIRKKEIVIKMAAWLEEFGKPGKNALIQKLQGMHWSKAGLLGLNAIHQEATYLALENLRNQLTAAKEQSPTKRSQLIETSRHPIHDQILDAMTPIGMQG